MSAVYFIKFVLLLIFINISIFCGVRKKTKVCLVLLCNSKGNIPGITYHRIGKSRYSLWLKAIGRNLEENISYNNVICSKHFEKSDFICEKGKTNIKKGAIPKHFLPKNVKFIREAEALQAPPVKKPRYTLDTEMQPTQSQIQREASCSGFSSKNECISSSDSAVLEGSPKRNKRLIKKMHTYHTTEDLVRQKLSEQKQTIGTLRYEKKKQLEKNKRLRKKVSHLQGIVAVIKRKNMLSPDACSLLEKSFSGIPLAVMKRMLANSRKGRVTRKKYDKVIRSFALKIILLYKKISY